MEIPKDKTGMELRDWLENQCDSQAEQTYFRNFEQSELDDARRQHADLHLILESEEKEFEEIRKEFKEKKKKLREEIKNVLTSVKVRGFEETAPCYVFKDYENKTVSMYTRFGTLINQRPMTPEERQLSIDHGAPIRNIREAIAG